MTFSSQRSRLSALTRDLVVHWRDTRATWTDAKGAEFEKEFLEPLLAAVERAQTALEQLDELATKVRKDCE